MMDWTQTLTIIGITVALFIFMMNRMDGKHKELSDDIKMLNDKIEANQKETNEKFEAVNQRLTIVETDVKNTNQRLSDFKTDMNQRLSTIEGYLVPRKIFRFEEADHRDIPKEN
ncbi:MAG: hypothetical protein AAGE84_32035 [Cyanobacteria bacterium P01_G01_bin.39]